MPTPQGHIRKRGSSYQIAVPVGRDPVTGRYRYVYEKAASLEAAKKLREEMLERVAADLVLGVTLLELGIGVWRRSR